MQQMVLLRLSRLQTVSYTHLISYRRKSSGAGSAYTARGSTAGGGKDAQRKSAGGSPRPADGKRDVYKRQKDNWWYNGEEIVPIYYESQGRHYMAVMNIDRVYFC